MRKRGEGTVRGDGYIQVVGRLKTDIKFQHVIIAEKALGKKLPQRAVVHHADSNRSNNENSNLVICPSSKYHMLLHMRMRAVEAGFPPHYRRCEFCRDYDDTTNLYIKPNGNNPRHRKCWNEDKRSRRASSSI